MTGGVADPVELLNAARSVLVVDWPTPDVPAGLARAGLRVFVHGGPRPGQYTEHEVAGDEVVVRHVDRPPDHADLVYSYRPMAELPEIVALAQRVAAGAIWNHPDTPLSPQEDQQVRGIVESAGFRYVCSPDIVDLARRARRPRDDVHERGTPS